MWPDGNAFIAQPFANHNGGHLAFGPDGYLYIGMGDGGSGNDPDHRAQNPASSSARCCASTSTCRTRDPDGYVVPPSNPFVDSRPVAALTEIWAFGLRNPWRFSFDDPALGGTGALVIGDVGPGRVGGDRLRAGRPRRTQLRLAQPRRRQPTPDVPARPARRISR